MSFAVYFYDNSNGTVDYDEINTTERPTCADKATLYSPMQLFSYFTTVADFITKPFLVYLSFAKVKNGLFKYFTLNLMATCSVITIADLVIDGINIVTFVANTNNDLCRNQKLHYIVLHISLLLWNGCIDFIRKQFSIIVPHHLTHLVLFIPLFVVITMVKFYTFLPPISMLHWDLFQH
ncbi:hypothetical protein X798_06696, partial [Onchocerca flexuosa]